MNTNETTTRRLESAELARLRISFAAFEAARDAADYDDCGCDDYEEAETWHSRFMGRVDRATSWTWGRGLVIAALVLLVFSGGARVLVQCLTGGN